MKLIMGNRLEGSKKLLFRPFFLNLSSWEIPIYLLLPYLVALGYGSVSIEWFCMPSPGPQGFCQPRQLLCVS